MQLVVGGLHPGSRVSNLCHEILLHSQPESLLPPKCLLTLSKRTWLLTFSFIFPLLHFCSNRCISHSPRDRGPCTIIDQPGCLLLIANTTTSRRCRVDDNQQLRFWRGHPGPFSGTPSTPTASRQAGDGPSSFPCCCWPRPRPWPPYSAEPWEAAQHQGRSDELPTPTSRICQFLGKSNIHSKGLLPAAAFVTAKQTEIARNRLRRLIGRESGASCSARCPSGT